MIEKKSSPDLVVAVQCVDGEGLSGSATVLVIRESTFSYEEVLLPVDCVDSLVSAIYRLRSGQVRLGDFYNVVPKSRKTAP